MHDYRGRGGELGENCVAVAEDELGPVLDGIGILLAVMDHSSHWATSAVNAIAGEVEDVQGLANPHVSPHLVHNIVLSVYRRQVLCTEKDPWEYIAIVRPIHGVDCSVQGPGHGSNNGFDVRVGGLSSGVDLADSFALLAKLYCRFQRALSGGPCLSIDLI